MVKIKFLLRYGLLQQHEYANIKCRHMLSILIYWNSVKKSTIIH